ncbi:MAG: glucosaminidase domain-containing protein, partial [Chloroflexota bacterium]
MISRVRSTRSHRGGWTPISIIMSLGMGAGALAFVFSLASIIHATVMTELAGAFRDEMVSQYGVPQSVADSWAWGNQPGRIVVTITPGALNMPVNMAHAGGVGLLPGDLTAATLAIHGQTFGGRTPLGGSATTFFFTAAPYAYQLHELTGIPTSTIMAQWANETAYGRDLYGWNFGNIKNFGTDPSGKTYLAFTSPEAGVRGEAQLLINNPRYKPLLAQRNPSLAATAWGLSGWAGSAYALPG